MLRTLRNRLLLVNMIALSIMMIAAFVIIYVVTYTATMSEIEQKVQRAPIIPVQNETGADDVASSDTGASQGQSILPVGYEPSFSLILNTDGEIERLITVLSIPYNSYFSAAESVEAAGVRSGQINFENRLWYYSYTAGNPLNFNSITSSGSIGTTLGYTAGDTRQVNFVDITEDMNSLARLSVTFVVAGLLMLVALFSLSFYFANKAIRPIEETWSKQKQFVADASHELKTPIAIIGANIDALESDPEATVGSQKKWTDYARHELDRMGKLINDLLYLAQSEDGKSDTLDFDLGKLVEEVCTSMEAVLFEKNIRFSQNIEEGVIVNADEAKINQALIILMDNAVKYTEPGGSITVSVTGDKNTAGVSVQNSGTGIDPNDLPRIFDRFYRPDRSRSTESGGYGLGLSIFRTIIERSGGRVAVKSENNVTEFSFTLKV